MKRLILMSVVLAATLLATRSFAGDIPCPVDQVLRETREQNARRRKTLPDAFYQGLAQNYTEQCQQANKTIAEFIPKLAEHEAGKRDDRDGYIILQKLINSYAVLKAEGVVSGQSLREKQAALARKHPNYADLRDFKLSEELAARTQKQEAGKRLAREASEWTPPDSVPYRFLGLGQNLIVQYQFRLEFIKLPSRQSFEILHGTKVRIFDSEKNLEVPLDQFQPNKTLTFRRSIVVVPQNYRQAAPYIAVCTNVLESWYGARTRDEAEKIKARGHRNQGMPWINVSGQYDDFCGVVTPTGEIVFKFPYAQKSPDKLLSPLGVTDDGRVAILVGESVSDDGESKYVGHPREVLIWERPDKFRRKSLGPGVDQNTLLSKFANKEL